MTVDCRADTGRGRIKVFCTERGLTPPEKEDIWLLSIQTDRQYITLIFLVTVYVT